MRWRGWGGECLFKKNAPQKGEALKCFHNGIILIVICFQEYKTNKKDLN